MTKDKHFGLDQGIDFVRGHVAPVAHARMQTHLDEGCGPCRRVVELWCNALEVARRNGGFEPPTSDTRWAKALFSVFQSKRRSLFNLSFLRMTCDSRPALEGVRGIGASTSHYLFEEGTVLLDLHIETSAATRLVSAVGQIFDMGRAEPGYEHRPVALMRGETEITRAVTDQFGAFHLEYSPEPDLLLIIGLQKDSYYISRLPPPQQGLC